MQVDGTTENAICRRSQSNALQYTGLPNDLEPPGDGKHMQVCNVISYMMLTKVDHPDKSMHFSPGGETLLLMFTSPNLFPDICRTMSVIIFISTHCGFRPPIAQRIFFKFALITSHQRLGRLNAVS